MSQKVDLLALLERMSEDELLAALAMATADPLEENASPTERSHMSFELVMALCAACQQVVHLPDVDKAKNPELVNAACEEHGVRMRDTCVRVLDERSASLGTMIRTRLLLEALKSSLDDAMKLRVKNDLVLALLTHAPKEGA